MLSLKGHNNHWVNWHVGSDMYVPDGPVLLLQADGHELAFIMRAIENRLVDQECLMHYIDPHVDPLSSPTPEQYLDDLSDL